MSEPQAVLRLTLAILAIAGAAWAGADEPVAVPDAQTTAERLAVASAAFDRDADLLVLDDRGVIVGVGRAQAGATFELRLLLGFAGPARLALLYRDGSAAWLDVVVGDRVLVADVDLPTLLAGRFGEVAVRRELAAAAGGGAAGPASPAGTAGPAEGAASAPGTAGDAPVRGGPGEGPPPAAGPGDGPGESPGDVPGDGPGEGGGEPDRPGPGGAPGRP